MAGSPRPYADPQQSACLTRTDLSLTLLFWSVLVCCFGWCGFLVLGFGLVLLVLIVRLIPRTPHRDLCLSAHIAPIPVQKKNSAVCLFFRRSGASFHPSGLDDEHGTNARTFRCTAVHKTKRAGVRPPSTKDHRHRRNTHRDHTHRDHTH